MSRTNIDLDDRLVRRARRLTGLRTKKAIVNRALESLVRAEARKGILKFYASGVWRGDLKGMRRSRTP
jgi:Arc/MetJ family transcription regulator